MEIRELGLEQTEEIKRLMVEIFSKDPWNGTERSSLSFLSEKRFFGTTGNGVLCKSHRMIRQKRFNFSENIHSNACS